MTETIETKKGPNVLITGASGYVGRLLLERLSKDPSGLGAIVATDINVPTPHKRIAGVEYVTLDVRNPALVETLKARAIDTIVHLAAIVTPGKGSNRDLEYSVDVIGTENVLTCSVEAGVGHFITTSSGAAYGYHPDNPEWIDEEYPIRGNQEFAYSHHKRLVEEMLARYRTEHPELAQLIFRPGFILGESTKNQITNLFEKPWVMGIKGSRSPFAIIWDQDVVRAIEKGIRERRSGIFNMAGDGALTLREMASMMGKPYLEIPVPILTGALWLLKRAKLTQYGPEQLNFLRYRPVLANRRLKHEFGFIPKKTTRQVFEYYLAHRSS